MEEKEFEALKAKLGEEATQKIKQELENYKAVFQDMIKGHATEESMKQARADLQASVDAVKEIVEKQGASITDILLNLGSEGTKKSQFKSIAEKLYEDREELANLFKNRHGVKEYMLVGDGNGGVFMKEHDTTKAAGPHATIADVGASGNVSSITQSIDAATLLRLGGGAPIYDQYRNTPWIFDLANTYTVGFENPFFLYYNEKVKQGTSATVPEGGEKPAVQYEYELKSETYKKEACYVSFTQEFSIDFERLHNEIMQKVRIDLVNRINAAIQGRILTAATAYNQGAAYKAAAGGAITDPNDWDVIAALAAQAENATFTNAANTAIVSTNKKWIMGTLKDEEKRWLGNPPILSGISMVSNPSWGNTNVIVGDMKQYNIALRGGIIVRLGWINDDFIKNKFGSVVEQFYFDYISDARKPAIVKGPDFSTVAEAIGA